MRRLVDHDARACIPSMKTARSFLLSLLFASFRLRGRCGRASAPGNVTFGGRRERQTRAPNATRRAGATSAVRTRAPRERRSSPEAARGRRVGRARVEAERSRRRSPAASASSTRSTPRAARPGSSASASRPSTSRPASSAPTRFPVPRSRRTRRNTLQTDSADHIGGRLTLVDAGPEAGSRPTSRRARSRTRTRRTVRRSSRCSATAPSARRPTARSSKVFHVGGAFELWLVNGTGAVGLDGGGTSAKFRALGTADLRGDGEARSRCASASNTHVRPRQPGRGRHRRPRRRAARRSRASSASASTSTASTTSTSPRRRALRRRGEGPSVHRVRHRWSR